jgi:ubiquinone/menaquinone biosynthesis C-methylase UbiE
VPDVYASIETAGASVLERLADVQELRAADPKQRGMLESYLDDLAIPSGSRVLEVGCGTGAVARALAARDEIAEVVAVDPSEAFLERARRLANGIANLTFVTGDGRALPFEAESFGAVVCHTVLSHVPQPESVLAEAARVAGSRGKLAVFDGDYATTTVALDANDPLQACVDAAVEAVVHDAFLVRRLPCLVRATGWNLLGFRTYGFLETDEPGYMLTLVDRGVDTLLAAGTLGEAAGAALKEEARRRAGAGAFFGFISYASLTAERPA